MDYSFIRLLPSFNQAKQMFDPKQAMFRYYDCISLHPLETYLQITNSKIDIVFNNSYKVSVIDCAENELKDITENVTIQEGVDINGIKQIAFEIVAINESWYGKNVFFKFESTIGPDVFYSNVVNITDENIQDTILLNYKSYGYFQGTDYSNFDLYQSIRIKAFFKTTNDETESATYVQTSGNVISKNPTVVFSENYVIPYLNNFSFRALTVNIKSDLVYIDCYRVTDKPNLKNGELIDNSNLSDTELLVHRDLDDYMENVTQLTPPFLISSKYPINSINLTIASINKLSITFTKPIVIGVGTIKIYSIDGILKATLDQTDIELDGLNKIISLQNIGNFLTEYAQYYVRISEGLIKSTSQENISITNNTDWTFKISTGDWSADDFSSSDFLIYEL